MTNRLAGKAALVTGAARGIGAATAHMMARQGARVLVTDILEDEGRAVVASVKQLDGQAEFMRQDVSIEAQWEEATAQAVERFGALHIVVNNAGVSPAGKSVESLDLENWREVMAVNLDGVFLGVKHGIRTIKQFGGGAIVNMSSIMGSVGLARQADYNCSKAGVKLLTKVAALECAKKGYNIRINCIQPGFVDTHMVRSAVEKAIGEPDHSSEKYQKAFAGFSASQPIGRLGTVEDIAHTVLFLASDEAAFITGSELIADGGYTAQ